MALRASSLAALIKPRAKSKEILVNKCFNQDDYANLCWAACVETAAEQQMLHPPDFLAIAKMFLQCNQADPCDEACDVDRVVCAFTKNGLLKARSSCPVAIDVLIKQLNVGTVAIGLKGSTNHMILVVGFYPEEPLFIVCDPAMSGNPQTVTFDGLKDYKIASGDTQIWERTWLDLTAR
jgi:hypothetical protein